LLTLCETNGVTVGRACYLIGYAKCFKVGQALIFAAVAPGVKIHIGERSAVRVLDTKAARNLNHFPRRREETRGAHRSKVVCAYLHLTPRSAVQIGANSPIKKAGQTWLYHDELRGKGLSLTRLEAWRACAAGASLQGEGDEVGDSIAAKDHHGEAARDDREKEGSGDGILHRRSLGTAGPGASIENEAGPALGRSDGRIPFPTRPARVSDRCGVRLVRTRVQTIVGIGAFLGSVGAQARWPVPLYVDGVGGQPRHYPCRG
jgi:hypothetical protein